MLNGPQGPCRAVGPTPVQSCVGWVQRSGTHQGRALVCWGGGLRCTPPTLQASLRPRLRTGLSNHERDESPFDRLRANDRGAYFRSNHMLTAVPGFDRSYQVARGCVGWVQRSGTHQPRALVCWGGGLRCTPRTLQASGRLLDRLTGTTHPVVPSREGIQGCVPDPAGTFDR
jgi:hypothetical protein